MPLLCLYCLEIYKDAFEYNGRIKCVPPPIPPRDKTGYYLCPKFGCEGEVIQIDEMILPTIRELTKKHYYTEFCCSAHCAKDTSGTYIFFRANTVLPSIPEGWCLERTENNEIVIRKRFDPEDPACSRTILENNLVLLDWSMSLEDYHHFEKSENFASMKEQLEKLEPGQEYEWFPEPNTSVAKGLIINDE